MISGRKKILVIALRGFNKIIDFLKHYTLNMSDKIHAMPEMLVPNQTRKLVNLML
jgi:hypothetical protein